MSRPFVYIAGLIRTGSTVLSEALSEEGRAMIVREPRLGTNRIVFRDADRRQLEAYGLEPDSVLSWPRRVMAGMRALGMGGHPSGGAGVGHFSGYAARAFRDHIVCPLLNNVDQVGIKEVRHDGWEHVVDAFPDTSCVAIGRDPRDMFLSHRTRVMKKGNQVPTPAAFAEEIDRQFRLQSALAEATTALLVRYEDLCLDPLVLGRIRAHVQSPVEGDGEVGTFTSSQALRRHEAALHGSSLSDRRVARWAREVDEEALAAAHEVFDLLTSYTSYWGYTREGITTNAPATS